MSWKDEPTIMAARDIAKKFNQTRVIIIMVDDEGGTIRSASYGANGALCTSAGKLADVAYDAVVKLAYEQAKA